KVMFNCYRSKISLAGAFVAVAVLSAGVWYHSSKISKPKSAKRAAAASSILEPGHFSRDASPIPPKPSSMPTESAASNFNFVAEHDEYDNDYDDDYDSDSRTSQSELQDDHWETHSNTSAITVTPKTINAIEHDQASQFQPTVGPSRSTSIHASASTSAALDVGAVPAAEAQAIASTSSAPIAPGTSAFPATTSRWRGHSRSSSITHISSDEFAAFHEDIGADAAAEAQAIGSTFYAPVRRSTPEETGRFQYPSTPLHWRGPSSHAAGTSISTTGNLDSLISSALLTAHPGLGM
ncbi:hypothetical protein H0H93_011381, partial [Arthromyces matolae]